MASELVQSTINDAIVRIIRTAESHARKKLARTRWEHDAPDLAQEVALRLLEKLQITTVSSSRAPEVVRVSILHNGQSFELEAFSRGAVNWRLKSLLQKANRRREHDQNNAITSFELPARRRTKDELIDAERVLRKLTSAQRLYLLKDAVGLMAGAETNERKRLSRARKVARAHAVELGL